MDIIIEFIQELIEKGYAYESEGDVYFRTRNSTGMASFHISPLMNYASVQELK